MKLRALAVISMFSFVPTHAFAYVDPGIVPALLQLGYVAIFGALSFLILRPMGFIRTLIGRVRGRVAPARRPEDATGTDPATPPRRDDEP